jgi:hypothetical protein
MRMHHRLRRVLGIPDLTREVKKGKFLVITESHLRFMIHLQESITAWTIGQ